MQTATQLICRISIITLLLAELPAVGDEFQPEYEKTELRGPDGAKYERVGIDLKPRRVHHVAGWRLVVESDIVEIMPDKPGEQPRRIASTDGRKLRLLGTTRQMALFAADNTKEEVETDHFHLRAEVRRLDLNAAAWLPSWSVVNRNGERGDAYGPVLGGILARHETVVVLSYDKPSGMLTRNPALLAQKTTSYTVTCFRIGDREPKWSKTFPWHEGRYPPAMLSGDYRRSDDPPIELLSWIDDGGEDAMVVVCAGAKQDLICLWARDGEEHWRFPKLWEFERGFIGPSVFEHYVDRFGIFYMDVKLAEGADVEDAEEREEQRKARKLLSESRQKFEDAFDGTIAAGPVVVPDDFFGHVFVAAARMHKEEHWQDIGGLAQCTVYEIDPNLREVIAATSLPRMIDGPPHKTIPGAVIWPCERGCLARLHHYEFDFSNGLFGPGAGAANDALCRVAWYREYAMRFPDCWFSADPPQGIAACDDNHLYRPAAAYIEKNDQPIYCFVINVVNLETGVDHDITLAIPYHGDFPMPETGYAKFGDYTHATQPHLLAISGLSVEDDVLRILMKRPGSGADDAALKFGLQSK